DLAPGGGCLLEGVGHYQRDVLAVVADGVVLEGRSSFVDHYFGRGRHAIESADVVPGVHLAHARHRFGSAGVYRRYGAAGDGGAHWHRVQHVRKIEIRGVARGAADFEWALHPHGRTADGGLRSAGGGIGGHVCSCQAAAVVRALIRQRFASSILKPFWLCGLASRSAASAAAAKVTRVAGLPINACSASGERQGRVPTPPSATRAWRIVPPSVASTTAAEDSANS